MGPVIPLSENAAADASSRTVIDQIVLLRPDGLPCAQVPLGQAVDILFHAGKDADLQNAAIALRVYTSRGERVATLSSAHQYPKRLALLPDTCVRVRLRNCRLMPGTYSGVLAVKEGHLVVQQVDLGPFLEVTPTDIYLTGRMLPPQTGLIAPRLFGRYENIALQHDAHFPLADWEKQASL